MHPCLLVDELLALICSQWDPDRDKDTLISFALTTRTFTDHALNMLWKSITTLRNLIKIMPEDLWATDTYSVIREFPILFTDDTERKEVRYTIAGLKRDIRPEDWVRFDYYARRIKLWDPCYNEQQSLYFSRDSLQQVLESRRNRHLFPSLRHIEFQTGGPFWEEILPIIPALFLPPSIQSVSISGVSRDSKPSDFAFLLDSISQYAASIQSVKLHGYYQVQFEGLEELVSSLICKMPNLQTVDLGVPISNIAINHIASLPDLRTLKLEMDNLQGDKPNPISFAVDESQFQTLTHLQATSDHGEPLCRLLRHLHRPLHSIDIDLDVFPQPADPPLDIQECLQALSTNTALPSSLISLSISGPQITQEITPLIAPVHPLNALFSFTALQEIYLDLEPLGAISDEWLAPLSRYWPKLRVFHMSYSLTTRGDIPKPMLAGVVSMVRGWDDLEQVGVTCVWEPFDVSAVGTLASKVTKIKRHQSSLGQAQVDGKYMRALFKCLITAFPNLVEIDLGYPVDSSWGALLFFLEFHKLKRFHRSRY